MTQSKNTSAGPNPGTLLPLAQSLLDRAMKAGADAAEVILSESRSLEVAVREGALEDVERSESRSAGLRVFIGKRMAGTAFSDLSDDGAELAVGRVMAMARVAPEDPYCGLVEREAQAATIPDIALYEASEWDAGALEAAALEMEAAALKVQGVAMVASSGASLSAGASVMLSSTGFTGQKRGSLAGLGIAAVAKNGDVMERDYDHHSMRQRSALRSPVEIGTRAGEQAVARLGSEKMSSGKMPVVFDKRVSDDFLGYLIGGISGSAIARGTSFLRTKLGERIFAEGIDVVEDPLKDWGHGSRAFDGEGVACRPRALIEDGVLTGWLLNAASARQLSLPLSGHASASPGGAPGIGVSNVHLAPGERTRAELISDAGNGLLVTEMFGASFNANTGDWSVGVAGFRIENGKIAGPVSESTVAGNMLDIFARLEPGSDLEFDSRVTAPSVIVDALSVGGR
ncbi:MAG: TldD/PmbA family protein [Oceanicaulis sp.]|uniref:TldD/PmbA family protein n=1 Tax=Glycocaulis sp. TaxID=1969725 RepID=UPI0025BCCF90|nr:TldD/PmbA family protein [Glycocaulis sp.]MCC5981674.1 TldD/PmbA family protein [Oceanicaulis sp.]MCH8520508.1 TldD/PmbA family protein [Glycocaulis sp.]